jgi:hypothetical protein
MAMVNDWIPLPEVPLLANRAEPYLVSESRLTEFISHVSKFHAGLVEADIADSKDVSDVVNKFKSVLPFPDWCGSSWDSIDDAFEELREGWSFPLVLMVQGIQPLLGTRPHLALEVVIRMSDISRAFSMVGDQFLVVYIGGSWG